MNFKDAVISAFRNFGNFEGRAIRSEYWYYALFIIVLSFFIGMLDAILFPKFLTAEFGLLGVVFSLATFVPSLSILVRRLHDIDRSGWWFLLSFTIIGLIPLIYWLVIRGTVGDNRFGPDALSPEGGAAPAPPPGYTPHDSSPTPPMR